MIKSNPKVVMTLGPIFRTEKSLQKQNYIMEFLRVF